MLAVWTFLIVAGIMAFFVPFWVYRIRNLEVLSDAGEIKKLKTSGRPKHFDAILEPHDHISCEICGLVDHIEFEQNFTLPHEHDSGYQVTGRIYYGACPASLKNNNYRSSLR
jgi:Fe2+ or Zn2+ uptake regulation protein